MVRTAFITLCLFVSASAGAQSIPCRPGEGAGTASVLRGVIDDVVHSTAPPPAAVAYTRFSHAMAGPVSALPADWVTYGESFTGDMDYFLRTQFASDIHFNNVHYGGRHPFLSFLTEAGQREPTLRGTRVESHVTDIGGREERVHRSHVEGTEVTGEERGPDFHRLMTSYYAAAEAAIGRGEITARDVFVPARFFHDDAGHLVTVPYGSSVPAGHLTELSLLSNEEYARAVADGYLPLARIGRRIQRRRGGVAVHGTVMNGHPSTLHDAVHLEALSRNFAEGGHLREAVARYVASGADLNTEESRLRILYATEYPEELHLPARFVATELEIPRDAAPETLNTNQISDHLETLYYTDSAAYDQMRTRLLESVRRMLNDPAHHNALGGSSSDPYMSLSRDAGTEARSIIYALLQDAENAPMGADELARLEVALIQMNRIRNVDWIDATLGIPPRMSEAMRFFACQSGALRLNYPPLIGIICH